MLTNPAGVESLNLNKVNNLLRFLSVFLLVVNVSCNDSQEKNTEELLVDLVNPFIGTDGPGNTYPGASLPFGMVQLSPDIGIPGWDRIAGYYYQDTILSGFSHMHLTGTGAGDLYDILIMPYNSRSSKRIEENGFRPYSRYSHDQESASPGYYSVDLLDYGISAELTATERVGIHRYRFPKDSLSQIAIDLGYALNWDRPTDTYLEVIDHQTIQGYRYSTGWARNQRVYFYIQFSQPFTDAEVFSNNKKSTSPVKGTNIKLLLRMSTDKEEEVIIKTGLSTASIDGAKLSIDKEAKGFDFDSFKEAAREKWETQLSKIKIETRETEDKKLFYSMLYQSMLAPTLLSDHQGAYKAANDSIGKAEGFDRYDTFSLWDTYRAAHPLYTLMHDQRVTDFIKSMLAHYEETGLLPVWSLQGNESNMMIGYHAVPVIVDAYFKGIRGYNVELAFKACVESATDNDRQIDQYMELGYVPIDEAHENWSVSKTLEYAYDDWCIAAFAQSLGKNKEYEYFKRRAEFWRNVFDTQSSFMRPRYKNGKFIEHFVAKEYTPYFCESNGWHYVWNVPQNIEGLIEIMGGDQRFEQKLDSMFSYDPLPEDELPIFSTGMIGQYAHGNEPSHHVAYLYNHIHKPWKTQEMVRKILTSQYANKPDGHCGNEDCGQMSSWYVLSSLGLYPVNPAQGAYSIGSPMIESAVLTLKDNVKLEIRVQNNEDNHPYVQEIRLNEKSIERTYISHQELLQGGVLEFVMGPEPKIESSNWKPLISSQVFKNE